MKLVLVFALLGIVGFAAAKSTNDEFRKKLKQFQQDGGQVKVYTNYGSSGDWQEVTKEETADDSDTNSNTNDQQPDEEDAAPSYEEGSVEAFLHQLGLL